MVASHLEVRACVLAVWIQSSHDSLCSTVWPGGACCWCCPGQSSAGERGKLFKKKLDQGQGQSVNTVARASLSLL